MTRRDVGDEGDDRLRGSLRLAFNRAPDLQPRSDFEDRLREQLREAATRDHRSRLAPQRWFALAAGVLLAAGLTATVFLNRSMFLKQSVTPADALARDAIGDHRNCALRFRLVRAPMPLEDAAARFDPRFQVLIDAPPDNISTPAGAARVIERHSCAYGARRFGHVVMQYRGSVVSLLMTATTGDGGDATPHLIGRPIDGLSVVAVNGARHAILLVSDLDSVELTQLSGAISIPLARLTGAAVWDDRCLRTRARVESTQNIVSMPAQSPSSGQC